MFNGDVVVGFCFLVCSEEFIVFRIEFVCGIVGDVEEFDIFGEDGGGECDGCEKCGEEFYGNVKRWLDWMICLRLEGDL